MRVTPRSSRNKVAWEESTVRVWVTAAPVDGGANDAVTKLLAKALGIAPSRLRLIRGDASREKQFRIDGMGLEDVIARLG